MKKWSFLFLILGVGAFSNLVSWETGAELSVSSLNFHPDRTPSETSFSAYYLPLEYKLYLAHQIDENMSFDLTFANDKILQRLLYGTFSYGMDYVSLQVGPFLGILNSSQQPLKAGIIASIEARFPGKAFIQLRSGRNLNLLNIFTGDPLSTSVSSEGDFQQENNEFRFGVYLRNTILSFFVASKIYTYYSTDYGTVSNSQTDYGARTDIFQKNVPLQIRLSFFYRHMSRYFEEATPSSQHTIGSLIFGTQLEYSFLSSFSLYADLESSIYSFGLNDLIGEFAGTDYLFTAKTGFRYRIPR
ncbi:MAG: hypothetical protein SNJ81_06040 [Cyanobacteriota bacterium]